MASCTNVIELKDTKCEKELVPSILHAPVIISDEISLAYLPTKKVRRIRECSDLRAWWDKEEEVVVDDQPVECA